MWKKPSTNDTMSTTSPDMPVTEPKEKEEVVETPELKPELEVDEAVQPATPLDINNPAHGNLTDEERQELPS